MIVLQYLLSQHAEHVKTADKQQVSDVSRFVSLPIWTFYTFVESLQLVLFNVFSKQQKLGLLVHHHLLVDGSQKLD